MGERTKFQIETELRGEDDRMIARMTSAPFTIDDLREGEVQGAKGMRAHGSPRVFSRVIKRG